MNRNMTFSITLAVGSIIWFASSEPRASIPAFINSGGCRYQIVEQGSLTIPEASLNGIPLGGSGRTLPIAGKDTAALHSPMRMENRGRISRTLRIHEASDQGPYVGMTIWAGGPEGTSIIAGMQVMHLRASSLSPPTFRLRPEKGSNCDNNVSVYANDESSISEKAMNHIEACDYVPPRSCGPKLPITMLMTCRLRSSFPKGRALYVVSSSDGTDTTSTLVDWDMMTAWRFDSSAYEPANPRRTCRSPF